MQEVFIRVYRHIHRFDPHHRQVFVVRELEGRPNEEIAAIAGCGVGRVKSRLNRARTAFASIVEPMLEG